MSYNPDIGELRRLPLLAPTGHLANLVTSVQGKAEAVFWGRPLLTRFRY